MKRILLPRQAVALLTARHENQIRRHCEPVACAYPKQRRDATLLYDADDCHQRLVDLPRRFRRVA